MSDERTRADKDIEQSGQYDTLIAEKDIRISALEAENNILRTGGIIEVAVRNPSVADYCKHWEDRATSAETKIADLTSKLRLVREAAKSVVSACHLRTHEFPEGDISDLDHSKLLPAVVALSSALDDTEDKPAEAASGKGTTDA